MLNPHHKVPDTLDASSKPTNEDGSVLIIVAVMLATLLGFGALTIDFGNAFMKKSQLQSLADSMALACGQFECENDPNGQGLNSSLFAPLLQSTDLSSVRYSVYTEVTCPDSEDKICTEVTTRETLHPYFLSILNNQKLAVSASAIVKPGIAAEPEELFGYGPAVMAKSTNANAGVYLSRQNLLIGASGFEIYGDVISNSAYGIEANNVSPKVTLSGGSYSAGPLKNINVKGKQNAIPPVIPDPCPETLPTPVFCNWNSIPCLTVPACRSNKTVEVPPGAYGNLDLKILSGQGGCTYKLSGVYTALNSFSFDLRRSGTIEAREAVFILHENMPVITASFNSLGPSGKIDLKAPTNPLDPHAGILIRKDKGDININDVNFTILGQSMQMDGVIYAKNGNILVRKGGSIYPVLTISGLIGNKVQVYKDTGSPIKIRRPSMPGVCTPDYEGQGGTSDGPARGTRLVQ